MTPRGGIDSTPPTGDTTGSDETQALSRGPGQRAYGLVQPGPGRPRRRTGRPGGPLDGQRIRANPGDPDGGDDTRAAQFDHRVASGAREDDEGTGIARQSRQPRQRGAVQRPGEEPAPRLVGTAAPAEHRTDVAGLEASQEGRHRFGRVLEVGVEAHPRADVRFGRQSPSQGPVLADAGRELSDGDVAVTGRQIPGDGGTVVGRRVDHEAQTPRTITKGASQATG